MGRATPETSHRPILDRHRMTLLTKPDPLPCFGEGVIAFYCHPVGGPETIVARGMG